MKVIIKEDNQVHKTMIKDVLIKIQIQLDLQFDIIISNDIKEILNYNNNITDVINIIDIIDEEQDINGLDLAQMIRNTNIVAPIIFLTAYDQFIQDAVNFNIQPLAYITKSDPKMESLLLNAFRKIIYTKSHFDKNTKLEFIDENSDRVFININDIFMIHTHPEKQKHVIIFSAGKELVAKGKVSDFELINVNIVRCSKSTLVNKLKISRITKGTNAKNKVIIFEGNHNIPNCTLSSKYKTNLM